MQMNFENMDVRDNVILIEDGHRVVSYFNTLIKTIETSEDYDVNKTIHPVALLLLDSNMSNLSGH